MGAVEELQEELEKNKAKLEHYKSLLEGTMDWIWETDVDWVYSYVSPQVKEMLGREPEDVIGKTPYVLMREDEAERTAAALNALSAAELPVIRLENAYLCIDGRSVLMETSAAPMFDFDGKLCGYRGVNRCVTDGKRSIDGDGAGEEKKTGADLPRSQRLEALGVLAGGIAHDFNNYLTGILGNISLAKFALKKNEIDRASGRLTEAEKAVEMSQALTRQILTFAKGEAAERGPLAIGDVLRRSAEFALSGSKTRCRYTIAPDIWLVDADEGQLSQAVNNIVLNAEQAMPEGGVIQLRAENVVLDQSNPDGIGSGRYVKVSFEDSGCGIPDESVKTVFEPYFTTKSKGSGLGLATANAIIKSLGGHITLKSELGAGSTFFIFIPQSVHAAAVDYIETGAAMSGSVKALVMDDEEIIRDVLNEILATLGYSVEFAYDGKGAVELYSAAMVAGAPFDLVVMDLTIPGGMGGMEAVKRVLKIDPKAKVIVSSGYSGDPIIANFRDYGFCGAVTKPYRIADVSRVVKSVLASS